MPPETRTRDEPREYEVFKCDLCLAEMGELLWRRTDKDIYRALTENALRGFVAVVGVKTTAGPLAAGDRNTTLGICEECYESLETWLRARRRPPQ